MFILKDPFCWIIRLRTGSLAVGFLHTVMSVFAVYLLTTKIQEINKLADIEERDIGTLVMREIAAICDVFSGIDILVSVILIAGCVQENPSLILPWLVWNSIMICLSLLGVGAMIIYTIFMRQGLFVFLLIIIALPAYIITIHVTRVVYSYYEQLKNRNNQDST